MASSSSAALPTSSPSVIIGGGGNGVGKAGIRMEDLNNIACGLSTVIIDRAAVQRMPHAPTQSGDAPVTAVEQVCYGHVEVCRLTFSTLLSQGVASEDHVSVECVRGLIALRASAAASVVGSGVSRATVEYLVSLLNQHITPVLAYSAVPTFFQSLLSATNVSRVHGLSFEILHFGMCPVSCVSCRYSYRWCICDSTGSGAV